MNAQATSSTDYAAIARRISEQAVTQQYDQSDDAAYFRTAHTTDSSVIARQLVERAIIRQAVTDILAAGYTIRVHDGEEWATRRLDNMEAIMDGLMSTDEEMLAVYYMDEGGDWKRIGSVSLIYGNDGHDVIADYSVILGDVLAGANALADGLSEEV